jgi:hypothetical protein
MPRNQTVVDQSQSMRWPKFFRDVEAAQVVLQEEAVQALLADCRDKAADLSYQAVHNPVYDPISVGEHNFMRGKISAYEDLAGLVEELREWKEAMK